MEAKEYLRRINLICKENEIMGNCYQKCPLKIFDCGIPQDEKSVDEAIGMAENYQLFIETWASKLEKILPNARWQKCCPKDYFGVVAECDGCGSRCNKEECWARPYAEAPL